MNFQISNLKKKKNIYECPKKCTTDHHQTTQNGLKRDPRHFLWGFHTFHQFSQNVHNIFQVFLHWGQRQLCEGSELQLQKFPHMQKESIPTLDDLRLLRNGKLRWTDGAKDNVAEKRSYLYLSDRKEEKTHLTHRVDKELFFLRPSKKETPKALDRIPVKSTLLTCRSRRK